jgi:hypothetical protein
VNENAPRYIERPEKKSYVEVVRVSPTVIVVNDNATGMIVMTDCKVVKIQVSALYHGQLCGLCGDMNGNKWDEYTTPEHKTYITPDNFVESFKSKSLEKLAKTRSRIADRKLSLKLKERSSESSQEKLDRERSEESSRELDFSSISSSPYEEESSSELFKSGKPSHSKRACQVGMKVNRVKVGDRVCISTGSVPKCVLDSSECASREKSPLRHVKVPHICVPSNSKTLDRLEKHFGPELENVAQQADRVHHFVRVIETSPRSEYREIGVDIC